MHGWQMEPERVERIVVAVDENVGELCDAVAAAHTEAVLEDVLNAGIPTPEVADALRRLLDAQAERVAQAAAHADVAARGADATRGFLNLAQSEMITAARGAAAGVSAAAAWTGREAE